MTETENYALGDQTEFLRRVFKRERSRLVVEIDLDPIPGWGHFPEDHRNLLERLLAEAIPHYNPTVEIDETARPATTHRPETTTDAREASNG